MNRARLLAHRSLVRAMEKGAYSDVESNRVLEEESLSPEDRNLYTQLYFGVTEKKITLDYILSQISTTPLNQCTPEVLALMELGAYQILYLERIPHHAAIYEAVELAKVCCKASAGLINAVLRRIASDPKAVETILALPGKKGLAIRYGYPRWLVSLWIASYGKEQCEKILAAQNHPAALTLRINPLKISLEDYEILLKQTGILYHKNPLCRFGITLERNCNPTSLPGYQEGYFFIQDAAAQRAIDKLEAKAGHRVLDLCAAPGGKSFGAAMDMGGQGEVLSFELHESRLERMKEGAARLGLACIQMQANDSSVPRADLEGKFDRVICDVPCSGYGTIAKKPDIRHKDPRDAQSLPELQKKILLAGANALKAGGRIVYSTCTLNPEENEAVTNDFLIQNPNFIRIGSEETIFPEGGEHDGFFCDLLEKQYD